MKELTDRQRQVLDFIRMFGERHGVPPTVREIGEKFGFTARAAFDHLRALERKGMLRRTPLKSRAISVTETGLQELNLAANRQVEVAR